MLVASNHGFDRSPAWLVNVQANPDIGIQIAQRRTAARAAWSSQAIPTTRGSGRVVESGDPDHPRLWRLVNETNHHRCEGYEARTDRPIPIVVVTPTESFTA